MAGPGFANMGLSGRLRTFPRRFRTSRKESHDEDCSSLFETRFWGAAAARREPSTARRVKQYTPCSGDEQLLIEAFGRRNERSIAIGLQQQGVALELDVASPGTGGLIAASCTLGKFKRPLTLRPLVERPPWSAGRKNRGRSHRPFIGEGLRKLSGRRGLRRSGERRHLPCGQGLGAKTQGRPAWSRDRRTRLRVWRGFGS